VVFQCRFRRKSPRTVLVAYLRRLLILNSSALKGVPLTVDLATPYALSEAMSAVPPMWGARLSLAGIVLVAILFLLRAF